MAILQMQRIMIYSLKKNRKTILETLQRRGVLEVCDLDIHDSVFFKEDTDSQQSAYLKNSSVAAQALSILEEYVPTEKSVFSSIEGRKPLSKEYYYMYVDEVNEIMRVVYEVLGASKKIADAKAEIVKQESIIESLVPWKNLDVPLNFKGTKKTAAFVGTFPAERSYEEICTALKLHLDENVDFNIEIISSSPQLTCLVAMCHTDFREQFYNALRKEGFSNPVVETHLVPQEKAKRAEMKIKEANDIIEKNIKYIKSFRGMKDSFAFVEDYFVLRAEKYQVIKNLANTKHAFVLCGYVPKCDAGKLAATLSTKYDAYVELEDVCDDDTPIKLKNNKFSEPVESVLKTYSMPKHTEVDPTSIMAIFYYVFFGMMFSDAGYGLVMTLGCGWALHHFKNMEEGFKKSVKMFFYCGISTMFWGVMFGSFFGDAVSVICQTFLHMDASQVPQIPGITTALWFNPVVDPMQMLMFSFLLGIIHLFTGLGIQAYMHIRDGHFIYAVYDVFSWYLLVGGGILALLSLDMMKDMVGFVLPPVFLTIGGICAAIGAVIILLFAGRESRNPLKRFLKGAYGLYGVTSYLSDILSYSRLLALGLATGVIAQVFNQIGSMLGDSIIAMILFALIFVVGHGLNIGINALGAYVHTNRLQFVEFFGKFYEGGGKEFMPFKINTKHYNIKEEI